jgi:hypothetical protein
MVCDCHGVGPGTPIVALGDGVEVASSAGVGVRVRVGGVVFVGEGMGVLVKVGGGWKGVLLGVGVVLMVGVGVIVGVLVSVPVEVGVTVWLGVNVTIGGEAVKVGKVGEANTTAVEDEVGEGVIAVSWYLSGAKRKANSPAQ